MMIIKPCRVLAVAMALWTGTLTADETNGLRKTLNLSDEVRAQCLTTLRNGMKGADFWPAIHAAEGLTLSGRGGEVRQFLEPRLQSETDDQKRCGIARELVRAGDGGKADVMLKILSNENPHGHIHAAESLYKVAEIGDGKELRKAMAQSANPRLQMMAAAALGRCGNPLALQLLRKRLEDPQADNRRLAAWVLARIGDPTDAPQLRELTSKATDAIERCFYEHALAAIGDAEGKLALKRNLSSPDAAVRTYAATFAGDSGLVTAASDLIKVLDDEHLDARLRAAQSLLLLSQPAPREPDSQLVFPATAENPRYTEGSVLRLSNGELIFAVTEFVGGGSDFSRARITARRSADGGQTWTEPEVLQKSTGDMNVMSVTLRRLKRADGERIAMFYLQKNSFSDLRVYVRFSDDEAKTFGEPILVTHEPGYHVMNNDRVTQLSSGRLLVPVASTPNVKESNHFVATCWISDDDGQSWRKGKTQVDQPKRGAMEPEVIELRDGRVLMIVRTQLGYIAASYSSDGGDRWSQPRQLAKLKAPEAPATLRRIPSTGDLLLIWNNTFVKGAGHGGARTPLTAAISSDEGRTWKHIRNLESRPDRTYSYPSLTFVKDRAVLSYWEQNGSRYSTRFRSLPVAWFYENP